MPWALPLTRKGVLSESHPWFSFPGRPSFPCLFFWAFHTTPRPALLISFPSPSLGSPEGWTLPENSACTSGVRTREPQMWKLRPLSDTIPGCCLTARAHGQVDKSRPWSSSLCLPLFSCPAATQPALPYSPPLLCPGVSPNFPRQLGEASRVFLVPLPRHRPPCSGLAPCLPTPTSWAPLQPKAPPRPVRTGLPGSTPTGAFPLHPTFRSPSSVLPPDPDPGWHAGASPRQG